MTFETSICDNCHAEFKTKPPENMDSYSIIRWREQNRLCEKCAQVEIDDGTQILRPRINKNWNPLDFNPATCDEGKIGIPPKKKDEEVEKRERAIHPMPSVFYAGEDD